MGRQKPSLIRIGLLTLFLVVAFSWYQAESWGGPEAEVANQTQQKLQEEKLRQEIRKLRLENDKADSIWGQLLSLGTLLTALATVTGACVTFWKYIDERSRQQTLDRQQRETESLRRLDEKFTAVVGNLGAESSSIQASAAVSIISFLKPEYQSFHEQAFMILQANLKIDHPEAVKDLLEAAFEKALHLRVQSAQEKGQPLKPDLSRIYLVRADLSGGLDLTEADLGFAQLRGANLTEANLFRVRGMEVNLEKARLSRANLSEARLRKAHCQAAQFHEANLVAVDLKEADLRKVQFFQARLQSAHLEQADLTGAKFEEAELNDTYFIGAKMDGNTLKSIFKAKNWQKAHFDEAVKGKLEEMAQQSG